MSVSLLLAMTHPARQFHWLLACLVALTVPVTPTIAQEDNVGEEVPSPYLVEIVIFRHLDQSKTTPETRRPENQVMHDPASGISFAIAPGEVRQLNATASAIRNLQSYQLIAHLAWIQTAEEAETAPLADLGTMGLNAAAALGTARLYERRFLHLDVQLELEGTGAVINSSRRIRLNQYYYLDNPDFGVVTLVTRAN